MRFIKATTTCIFPRSNRLWSWSTNWSTITNFIKIRSRWACTIFLSTPFSIIYRFYIWLNWWISLVLPIQTTFHNTKTGLIKIHFIYTISFKIFMRVDIIINRLSWPFSTTFIYNIALTWTIWIIFCICATISKIIVLQKPFNWNTSTIQKTFLSGSTNASFCR